MKTSKQVSLLATLQELKDEVRRTKEHPGAFSYLPDIEIQLEWMIERISKPNAERSRSAGALGRVVTESHAFSDSDLGTRLLKAADAYADMDEDER